MFCGSVAASPLIYPVIDFRHGSESITFAASYRLLIEVCREKFTGARSNRKSDQPLDQPLPATATTSCACCATTTARPRTCGTSPGPTWCSAWKCARDDREQGLRLNVYLCEGTAPATLSLLKWHSYYASAYFLRLPHNAGKLVPRIAASERSACTTPLPPARRTAQREDAPRLALTGDHTLRCEGRRSHHRG